MDASKLAQARSVSMPETAADSAYSKAEASLSDFDKRRKEAEGQPGGGGRDRGAA